VENPDLPPPPDDVPAVSAEELGTGVPHQEARRYPSTLGGVLYLVVLAVAVAGLAVVVLADWRLGIRVVGGALVTAALFRLVLRRRDAGMLAVRHRLLDATMLAGVGAVLIFLAQSIPNQPGT
jgi:hypothetical protein